MDVKRELLKEYNEKINNLLFMQDQQYAGSNSWNTLQKEIEKYQEIRDKIESAIFDVPSNDEMENKQQTAVEWLIDKIGKSFLTNKDIQQALELEKQQIENAKAEGYNFATSEAIKEIQKKLFRNI